MEAVARADPASSTTPLLQVGVGGPHRGVVGEVVMRGEQLHFGPAGEREGGKVCGERGT